MNKTVQINEETKRNIMTAFWSIYKNKNIDKISVTEVIEKAGYNRSTFYYYFKNVQAVLDYIEDEILDHLMDITLNKHNIYALDQEFGKDLINLYDTYGDYICFLLSEKGDPNFLTKFQKTARHIYYKKQKIGKEDKKEGDKSEIIYAFLTSAFIGSFLYWSNNYSSLSIKDFFEISFNLSNIILKANKDNKNIEKDIKK